MADTTMNLASPAQLDVVDRLRGLGISNFVALPQVSDMDSISLVADIWVEKLAVVGDQSRYAPINIPNSRAPWLMSQWQELRARKLL
jgi:hypothetical protein